MPNNYDFIDAHSSILTAESSVISGSVHRPIVTVGSFLSAVPTTASGNQSVSGRVDTSMVGMLPGGTNVLGSVATLQGTNPWITTFSNSSILTTQQGTVISSIVNTVPSSVIVGASIFGQLPAGTAVIGSVATLQGTSPWNIAGSVLAVQGTWSGSILAHQGIWSGSVLSQQLGTRIGSVVNSIPSSLLAGIHGHRNDAVASYLGADLSYRPIATDSAGRIVTKFFAPEESRVEGYASTVNVSVTTLVAAAGAGLRNYITDVWLANTGSVATLVTFRSGGGTSVLGYTIAPSGSGSNLPGLIVPIRTLANETFDIQASTGVSVLYATVKGFRAP